MIDNNSDLIDQFREIKCASVKGLLELDDFIDDNTSLKIIYTNIRSYNKNFDTFLVYLNVIKTRFHIIILGETWGAEVGAQLEGCKTMVSSKGRTRNDGLVMFIREGVNVSSWKEEELGDVFGMSVELTYCNRKCNLLTIYRTHDSDLDNLTNALSQYYSSMDRGKSYIFVGDVNADILNTDNKTERYLDVMYEANFMCGVNEPTRVAGDSRTCIDHLFINHDKYDNVQTAVIQTDVTDHYSVYLQIQFGPTNRQAHSAPATYIDDRAMSDIIKKIDWSVVTNAPGVNDSASKFMEIFFFVLMRPGNSALLKTLVIRN